MAGRPRLPHAEAVPLRYDPDGPGPMGQDDASDQPDPTAEAHARRATSARSFRALLGDRPEGFTRGEWRTVLHSLAPEVDPAAGPAPPGSARAREARLAAARDCFPAVPPTTALRLFREAQQAPHVVAFISGFRALELADVVDQRAIARETLLRIIGTEPLPSLSIMDPRAWAAMSLAQVAAVKALVAMDGLSASLPADAAQAAQQAAATSAGDDPAAALRLRLVQALSAVPRPSSDG